MTPATTPPATLDDLAKVDGKAELINGRIVHFMPSGYFPCRVARKITRSLEDYALRTGVGEAFGDNLGYAVVSLFPANTRGSFSPDASYYNGPFPLNRMKFIEGAPTFAVEVRSENDYGPAMDQEYEDKRKDYFFAGTQVVWDVDPKTETVTVYKLSDPTTPAVFRRGDSADAEPAVPGWRLKVDDIFA
jgi:Uma2 family endonuclease